MSSAALTDNANTNTAISNNANTTTGISNNANTTIATIFDSLRTGMGGPVRRDWASVSHMLDELDLRDYVLCIVRLKPLTVQNAPWNLSGRENEN